VLLVVGKLHIDAKVDVAGGGGRCKRHLVRPAAHNVAVALVQCVQVAGAVAGEGDGAKPAWCQLSGQRARDVAERRQNEIFENALDELWVGETEVHASALAKMWRSLRQTVLLYL
jgi:hypothetical protein